MAAPVGRILRTTALALLILAAGVAAFVLFVATRETPAPETPAPVFPLVRTAPLEASDILLRVPTFGNVMPLASSTVAAEVAGRVVELSPSLVAGGFVEQGEVLARIDPRDYELALARARFALAQARSALALEEARARVAREEVETFGKGVPRPLALREPQLAEARAAADSAEAALQRAELDRSRTRVAAPYAARIRARRAEPGDYVTPGAPVAELYPVEAVEVRLPVPQEDLAHLDLPLARGDVDGPPVTLRADLAGALRVWRGRIVRTEGEVDPKTRTIQAVARIDDPYDARPPLLVGLFVEAEIEGRRVAGAYEVPRAALRERDRLLVVDAASRLRFREVEVVRDGLRSAVVRSGVRPGDRLVVSPIEAPVEGLRVRVP